jgi:hypothetical protein
MKRKFAPFFKFMSISAIFALFFVSLTLDGQWITLGAAEAADPAIDFSINNPGIQKAIEVQDRNSDRLMSIPGVVGHGVGISEYDEPVIKIFVARAGIPGLPADLEGIPTKVVFTGMIVAYTDPTARFSRPVPIGVSTGHPDITAGTIGCRVIDEMGNVYSLSNNHVYANQNDAEINDNVLQPGPYDGGTDPADAIGALAAFVPIDFSGGNNTMDAAIALSSTGELGTRTPDDGYGTPSSTLSELSLNMLVQKYGRTTGRTHGKVEEINVTVDVCYEVRGLIFCVKQARFVGQIGISDGTFSAGGDSGSLIVTANGNNPVGLLFAGGSTRTFANHIGAVLEAFDVSVDGGGSSPPPENEAPIANFTYTTSDLTANFTDTSSDDGTIVSWSWNFAEGTTSTAQNPSHTYAAAGTYTVSLTVTDNEGETGSTSKNVTVTSGSSAGITLTATGYKVRGRQMVDLSWIDTTSEKVDIYRNGTEIVTTANNGFYTDNIGKVGGGSYVYKVCEAGTSACSNEATVTF